MTLLSVILRPSVKTAIIGAGIIAVIFALLKRRKRRPRTSRSPRPDSKNRVKIDMAFLKRLWRILKMGIFENNIPRDWMIFNFSLVFRSLISIHLTTLKGKIVKSIIGGNAISLNKNLVNLGLFAWPGGFVNSFILYMQKRMALNLRKGIDSKLNQLYLRGNTCYQMLQVDNRMANPDQIITVDLEKFCGLVFQVYGEISKPLLDIILFSRRLSQTIGLKAPLLMGFWYLVCGFIIKAVTPSFGRLMAKIMNLEGIFRAGHQRILTHSEEVAFLRGSSNEKSLLNQKLGALLKILKKDAKLRFYMGILDSVLIKYGAFTLGNALLAVPVFGTDSHEYILKTANNPTKIMKDYETNSGLLVNFAKAIGKISISYKKVQELAGACQRVNLLTQVCDDLIYKKTYHRHLIENQDLFHIQGHSPDVNSMKNGIVNTVEDYVKFDSVPIIQPNGEQLIEKIHLKVNVGENTLISGSNGTGKTALVRVLSGLWPLAEGTISIVKPQQILFLPQKAYMPRGSLRDLIIYPNSRSRVSDAELRNIIDKVHLSYLRDRVGGLDAELDWAHILSGGERQRLSVARIYYHRPKFAVLDETTSEVNPETENQLYIEAKNRGVTLLTVSQRDSLKKHHQFIFRILDNQQWSFEKFDEDF